MAVKQLASKAEAVGDLNELLNASVQRERFMVAVWDVEGGRLVYRGKICWNFPHGDFLASAAHLLEDMRREIHEQEEKPAPLRLAELMAKSGVNPRIREVEERIGLPAENSESETQPPERSGDGEDS